MTQCLLLVVYAGLVVLALYGYFRPPKLSKQGRHHFRQGMLCAVLSLILQGVVIWESFFFKGGLLGSVHTALLFWTTFSTALLNGVAVYQLLRVLFSLLPFSHGVVEDITPTGVLWGIGLGVLELPLLWIALCLAFGF